MWLVHSTTGNRRWLVIALLTLACLLAGCCRDSGTPTDVVAGAVATWLATKRGFRLRRRRSDPADRAMPDDEFQIERHKAAFAFQRARTWAERHPELKDEPDFVTIKARVEAEFDQVEPVARDLVGRPDARGPYYGGTDPKQPPHLELGELVTHVYESDPAPVSIPEAVAADPPNEHHAVVLAALDKRRRRVLGIVWRSAAIDEDVWLRRSGEADLLRMEDLVELLDRRLRSVELLEYRASVGATPDGIGSSFIRRQFDPSASWQWVWYSDLLETVVNCRWADNLDRPFEAPSLPAKEFSDFFASRHIVANPEPRFASGFGELPPPWYRNAATGELDWNEWPGTQILPLLIDPNWTGHPKALPRDQQLWLIPAPLNLPSGEPPTYAWIPSGVEEPSTAIRSLFMSSDEWWQRSWLHPNGVLAAIQFEGLLHAKSRRDTNDEAFNTFGKRFVLALDDYFGLRGFKPVEQSAMQPGRTDYFQNDPIDVQHVQIGDQILFETNLLVFALAGWWDYPAALVTDVDTNPDDQRIDLRRLMVQGFGSVELRYSDYQRLLAQMVDKTINGVHNYIEEKIKPPPPQSPPSPFPWTRPHSLAWDIGDPRFGQDVLHDWSPYPQEWSDPGPWWLRIYLDDPIWRGAFGEDLESAVKRLPRSVALVESDTLLVRDDAEVRRVPLLTGFQPPPLGEGFANRYVFAPLYEPTVDAPGAPLAGWYAYFLLQGQQPISPWLQPVRADSEWLPGLARVDGRIRTIRSRCLRP